ncbi:fumarylacetoacetate hydrolase family protein [Marinobacterium lutimaris]|uniref:Fumarylacetoacetate (FAA) hydrolase family protein n=1 Tax=Marinobacterium lutimaris TaxID=568106 RepID=A0A1H6DLJ5_9GAMM|nr:fumarylacetoacetate hydrolase family protein [Marinobacterium lutimaris]SEG86170.1 Fumarylacetoacetate (FAA) hydrolase family protein [Marinobacterium lutimaris]
MTTPLIDLLSQAWTTGPSLSAEQAKELAPKDFPEAYSIQQQVGKALGWFDAEGPKFWKLGGPKGGSTGAGVPISLVRQVPADIPVQLFSDDACNFTALEVELAVRLGQPLEPGCTLEDACAAVAEVYLAIEVCDLRAENWQELPPTYRLADQQMSRGFLLTGTPLSGWRDELKQISPTISINDTLISEGLLSHPQDHPLAALPWLANLSAALYDAPLSEGTVIATGTWAGMHLLAPGDHFRVALEGFDSFDATLDSAAEDATAVRFLGAFKQSK